MHIRRRTQDADVSRPMVKCKCVGSHLAMNVIPDRLSIIKIIVNKIWFILILFLLADKERVNCSKVPKNDIYFHNWNLRCTPCSATTADYWHYKLAVTLNIHFPSGGQAMQMHIFKSKMFSVEKYFAYSIQ